jgi:hypothetical protein
VLASLFMTASVLMDAGFYVRRCTGLKLGITMSAAAVILVLYTLLIPAYGAMGAALATLLGFIFLAFATWRTAQRIFPVDYEWSRLSIMTIMAVVLWLVSRLLPEAGWAVAAKCGLWLLWPLLVWLCRLPSAEEKEYVRTGVHEALEWMGLSRTRRDSTTALSSRMKPGWSSHMLRTEKTESIETQGRERASTSDGLLHELVPAEPTFDP